MLNKRTSGNAVAGRLRLGKGGRSARMISRDRAAGAAIEALEPRRLLSAAVTPIISEILAGNKNGIRDSFGINSDWLEIGNPDAQHSIDLTNWKIKYKSTVWNFPAMMLGPNEYRVIFAD